MKPRTLGFETLDERTAMAGVTASDIRWEPEALSHQNDTATLVASAAVPTFAMDLALPDGSRIARGLQNGNVEIFDTATGTLIHTIAGQGTYASQIEASPDGRFLAVGTGAPKVRVFDAQTYREVHEFSMPGFVYSIVFRGNEIFASAAENNATTVYNIDTRSTRMIAGGSNPVNHLATINDRLYGFAYGGVLKELNPQTGAVLRSVSIPGGRTPVASSSSTMLALGTLDGRVLAFDAELRQLGAFQAGIGSVFHVGFDESGSKLIARSITASVFLDLSQVQSSGMMIEAGRTASGDPHRYEAAAPMTPDGTVAFLRTEQFITAKKTPWNAPEPVVEVPAENPDPDAVDQTIEDIAHDIRETFDMPEELTTLIAEATRMAQTEPVWRAPEGSEAIQTVLPKGVRVNLRGADGIVTGYRATIGSPSTTRAYVYRGADLIHTQDVATGAVFVYENEEGITDVLLQGSFGTAIAISNAEVEIDDASNWSSTPDALTAMSSGHYARTSAIAIPQPLDMGRAVQQVEATWPLSGNGSHGSARMFINRNPNEYTLVRLNLSQGSARIVDMQAIKLTGEDYRHRETVNTENLQAGFLERINDRTFLIAPGMPQGLVIYASFMQSSQYSIQTTNGATREALLPPATMSAETVSLDLLVMKDHHRTEGVFPGVSEIVQGSSPTFSQPGDIANMQYHVRNTALNGGTVNVDVYVSWYAGEPTRGTLQGSFSIPLAGGDTRVLSANVTAPSKPADATSDRPSIHVVTRLPNGQTVEHAKLGKLPKFDDNYSPSERDRLSTLNRRAVDVLMTSTHAKIVAARNAIGLPGMEAITRATYEEAVDVVIEDPEADVTNAEEKAITAAQEEIDSILEQIDNSVTPEKFMETYLTTQGKLRFLHLLETEEELSSLGIDVAAAEGFHGSFDSMFEGMFGRAKMKIEPIDLKPLINISNLPLIKSNGDPISTLVQNALPAITAEDPFIALQRRVEQDLAAAVNQEMNNYLINISMTVKREIIAMKRAAIWSATQAYIDVHTGTAEYLAGEVEALGELISFRLKNLTPLLMAEKIESALERHNILESAGVMEYHPSDGQHPGDLIVLINGHLQGTTDNPQEVGMEYLEQQFVAQGYEVIQFRVGLALEPYYRNPGLIYDLTEKTLFDRLNRQGIFSNAPAVQKIAKAGYSWGGGTAAKTTNKLAQSEFRDIPVYLGLIDAVHVGYDGLVQPITNRPLADAVFNRYQQNQDFTIEQLINDCVNARLGNFSLSPILISRVFKLIDEGQPAHGAALPNAGDDQLVLDVDHLSIDDTDTDDGERRLNAIRDFFLQRL